MNLFRVGPAIALTLVACAALTACAPAATPQPAATVTVTAAPAPAEPTSAAAPLETPAPVVETPAAAPAAPAPAPAPAAPETFTMPAVVGVNLQLAQDTLQALGSYVMDQTDASGLSRLQINDSNWQVCTQDPAPGSVVPTSTLVTLASVKLGETCP